MSSRVPEGGEEKSSRGASATPPTTDDRGERVSGPYVPGFNLDRSSDSHSGLDEWLGVSLDDASWFARLRACRRDPRPQTLGAYEVLGEAGRGGQGLVLHCRQPRTGREVAVKRLSAGLFATPEMRARFEREIEAASLLDHPNIVTVYGSEVIDGQPVLVMQWIDGIAFDRWSANGAAGVAAGRRGPREVLALALRVCDAVYHAHQRGVIHRDLKPSNILVDASGQPHVLDFGVAKLERDARASAVMTQTGDFVGTPAYAAPEQLRGDARAVDVRSDVYSLGAVLYQALTGRLAFDGAGDAQQLLRERLARVPEAPSAIDSRLDREIDAITLKSLRSEPNERYDSAADFAADLRRYLNGQAVAAHPPSTTYRMRKFVRAHRLGLGVASAFALVLIGATIVSAWLFLSAERARRDVSRLLEVEKEQQRRFEISQGFAGTEFSYREATDTFFEKLLGSAQRGAKDGVPTVTLREALDSVSADLDAGKLTDKPDEEATMRMIAGRAYAQLGLPRSAVPHFLKALEIRQALHPGGHNDTIDTMNRLGRQYRVLGRLDDAERMLEGAVNMRRGFMWGKPDAYFASNICSLALLKRNQRKLAEAEALFLEALDNYRNVLGPDNENIFIVRQNLGLVYLAMARNEEAAAILQDTLDGVLLRFGESFPELTNIESNLGLAMHRLGRSDEAELLVQSALERLVRTYGTTHPAVAAAQGRLASFHKAAGRFDEAETLILEAIEIYRGTTGQATEFIRMTGDLALLYREIGRLDEAETLHRETLHMAAESLPPNHDIVAVHCGALGALLIELNCFEEAESLLLRAEPLLKAIGGDHAAQWRSAQRDLVRLYVCWMDAAPGAETASRLAAARAAVDAP